MLPGSSNSSFDHKKACSASSLALGAHLCSLSLSEKEASARSVVRCQPICEAPTNLAAEHSSPLETCLSAACLELQAAFSSLGFMAKQLCGSYERALLSGQSARR